MFVTKRKYELEHEFMDSQLKQLRSEYWTLRADYDRLLNHLGLVAVKQPAAVVLQKAPGPRYPLHETIKDA